MAKKPFELQDNLEKVIIKIQEKPYKVMNEIGKSLAKEIRSTTLKTQYHQRRAILQKTLGYWARKQEKDLQIGFKLSIPGIVGRIMDGTESDPIKEVVVKNADTIKELIGKALDEIRSDKK